jgi:hypothetical protein
LRSFCYVLKATIAVARMNSILSCSTYFQLRFFRETNQFLVFKLETLEFLILFITIKFFLRLDLACCWLLVIKNTFNAKPTTDWLIFFSHFTSLLCGMIIINVVQSCFWISEEIHSCMLCLSTL